MSINILFSAELLIIVWTLEKSRLFSKNYCSCWKTSSILVYIFRRWPLIIIIKDSTYFQHAYFNEYFVPHVLNDRVAVNSNHNTVSMLVTKWKLFKYILSTLLPLLSVFKHKNRFKKLAHFFKIGICERFRICMIRLC